jgi:hypothetical protein
MNELMQLLQVLQGSQDQQNLATLARIVQGQESDVAALHAKLDIMNKFMVETADAQMASSWISFWAAVAVGLVFAAGICALCWQNWKLEKRMKTLELNIDAAGLLAPECRASKV